MSTIAELLTLHRDLNSDSARLDAELLLCAALGQGRTYLFTWPERQIEPAVEEQYRQAMQRRMQGEPVAHILGEREFWSLPIKVNNSTLIPRPDTETLVEWALELDLPERAQVLDLGTGTGAIALALASENADWQVTAADFNHDAVVLAEENKTALGISNVTVKHSNWYQSLSGESFDLIVSNPPYIAVDDKHLAQGDVRFEPSSALVAEEQGLADLSVIIKGAVKYLNMGGWLLVEHGFEQARAVRAKMQKQRLANISTHQDLGGNERITGGQWRHG